MKVRTDYISQTLKCRSFSIERERKDAINQYEVFREALNTILLSMSLNWSNTKTLLAGTTTSWLFLAKALPFSIWYCLHWFEGCGSCWVVSWFTLNYLCKGWNNEFEIMFIRVARFQLKLVTIVLKKLFSQLYFEELWHPVFFHEGYRSPWNSQGYGKNIWTTDGQVTNCYLI